MESYFQKFKRIIGSLLGKRVDYDKAYWYQCVDFARWYCKEAWYPIGTFSGSAWMGWVKGSPFDGSWRRIKNDRIEIFPEPGDIVFWGPTKWNPYGHVAVAGEGSTPIVLNIIEQNAGSGNGDGVGKNAIKTRSTNYIGCVGWYHHIS